MQALHRCGQLLRVSHVPWSMCLCVGHTGELCKNGWNDLDVIWGRGLTRVGPRNHVLDRAQNTPQEGQFWELSGPLKKLGVSAAVYAAKGIIHSSITARQQDCCSQLQCSRLVGVTLHCPCKKSATPCDAASSFLWPLVIKQSHRHIPVSSTDKQQALGLQSSSWPYKT